MVRRVRTVVSFEAPSSSRQVSLSATSWDTSSARIHRVFSCSGSEDARTDRGVVPLFLVAWSETLGGRDCHPRSTCADAERPGRGGTYSRTTAPFELSGHRILSQAMERPQTRYVAVRDSDVAYQARIHRKIVSERGRGSAKRAFLAGENGG